MNLDRAIFELIRSKRIQWLQLEGRLTTIGAETFRVVFRNHAGYILLAHGDNVPTATGAGFAKGCLFIKDNAVDGVPGIYENIGTTTSCNFSLESATPGEIALDQYDMIIGTAGGVGTTLTIAAQSVPVRAAGDIVSVTIAASRVLGRLAAGNVGAIQVTAAEIAANAAIALSQLATQAANTMCVNATAGAAVPTAVAVSAQSVLLRAAGNLTDTTIAEARVLGRATGGNLGAIQITDEHIAAGAAIALTKLANQAALTFVVNATNGAAAPTALALAANQILHVSAVPAISALTITRKSVLGASATVLANYALAAGSLLTADANDLVAVAIAAGEVVVGATGPVIDGVALATGSILIGATGATPVALDIAVNEVLYRIAAGTLDGLALTRLQLLKGGAANLELLTVAAGDIVTADATDVAVVAIAAGEVVVGVAGPAIAGLVIAANELLSCDNAGALDSFNLSRSQILTGGATQLNMITVAAGDLVTANATDLVVVGIAAGEVVVGATGPAIDGVALATGSILIGATGATPAALDIAVNEVLYRIAAGTLDGLALAAGSLLTGGATQLAAVAIAAGEVVVGATGPVIDGVALATGQILKGATGATPAAQAIGAKQILYFQAAADISVLTLAAGDLLTADATDLLVLSIAAGEVVVGATGPVVDGVALADNQLLIGATGATPVALAVAASRVVGRTAAGVLDDIQVDSDHLIQNSVDPEHMRILTKTTEATDGNVVITAAQLLGGYYVKTGITAGRNLTLDATANILAVMGTATGSWFDCIVYNNNGAGQVLTVLAGDGNATLVGDNTINDLDSVVIRVVRTGAGTLDAVIVGAL